MSPLAVNPLAAPPHATVPVPGSKSLTNRMLLAAALADGESVLDGALVAGDTAAMVDCLTRLGVALDVDGPAGRVVVHGTGGRFEPGEVDLDARQAGTVARFLPPVVATRPGTYRFDGDAQLRKRPMKPMLEALGSLGASVEGAGEGTLPFTVRSQGPVRAAAPLRLRADVSSQFVSGLLMAGPLLPGGLRVELETDPVSAPYLDMTVAVMAMFGVTVERPERGVFVVPAGSYAAGRHRVEPDASAASYFFAAAAICEGSVTVPGLGRHSLQGDLGFVDLLAAMGAHVTFGAEGVRVAGTGTLRGIEADMAHLSDTAQTLAAVAVFSLGTTRVTGIGFVRGKETDRVAAVVRELRRCGIDADEEPDGFVVHPGTPQPARVVTDGDHRMAMSFALLGLRAAGIEIDDPDCVSKTFPGYWQTLELLR